jgi:hypothetical protein
MVRRQIPMVTEQLKMIEDAQVRYLRMELAKATDPKRRQELKEQLDKLDEGLGEISEKQTLLVE